MYKRFTRCVFKRFGLLLVSLMIILFLGNFLVGKADDTQARFGINVYLKTEGDSGKGRLINDFSPLMDVSNAEGTTRYEVLKRGLNGSYNDGYTMYDEINIYFDYKSHSITSDVALERLHAIGLTGADATSIEQAEQLLAQFPDETVDMTMTREKMNELVVPQKINGVTEMDGYKYQYLVPDAVVYLKHSDYTMTIKYVMPDGTAAFDDWQVSGYAGKDPTTIVSPTKEGYEPDQKAVQVNFSKPGDYITTVHYRKPGSQTSTTAADVDKASLIANDRATVNVGQRVDATTFKAVATDSQGNTIPVTVDAGKADLQKPGTYTLTLRAANGKTKTVTLVVKAVEAADVADKQSAVYSLKTLNLYPKPTFNQKQRLAKYIETTRVKRPMFVVIGYAHSDAGLLRYRVRDVNHRSKTAGKTGYITAKSSFVVPVYYHKTVKQIKILNRYGINEYKDLKLTQSVRHVKKNRTLKVVGLQKYHRTTRFVLSNGHYLTANKKLVMAVK